MQSRDTPKGKIIILEKAFDSSAKKISMVNFILYFFGGVAMLYFVDFSESDWTPFFILAGFATVLLLAGRKFISKALQTEKWLISGDWLFITRSGFLKNEVQAFEIKHISGFSFLDSSEHGRHPLAGETVDYMGFNAEQHFVNEMGGDKRIGFKYGDRYYHFGEQLYSWEFEEIRSLVFEGVENVDVVRKNYNLE